MTDTAKQLAAELFPRDDEAAGAAAMMIQRVLGERDAELAKLRNQVSDLEAWKESQLAVEATWDPQEVGRELGLTLAQNIRENILPGIRTLKTEVARLLELDRISAGASDAYRLEISQLKTALRKAAEEEAKLKQLLTETLFHGSWTYEQIKAWEESRDAVLTSITEPVAVPEQGDQWTRDEMGG